MSNEVNNLTNISVSSVKFKKMSDRSRVVNYLFQIDYQPLLLLNLIKLLNQQLFAVFPSVVKRVSRPSSKKELAKNQNNKDSDTKGY